jgi:hypothetical protein
MAVWQGANISILVSTLGSASDYAVLTRFIRYSRIANIEQPIMEL